MTRMMFWTLVFALVLIFGGVLAQLMSSDSGVIMVTWNGWLIETTFWDGVGIILTTFIVLLVLISLWRKLGPTRLISHYKTRRDQKTAKKETAIAIESWLRGADDRALKALQRVANAGGSDRLPSAVSLAIGMSHGDWSDRYAHFIAEDPELKLFANTLLAERFWQANKVDDYLDLMKSQFELRQIPWLRERFWQSMLEQGKSAELVTLINEAANVQPETRQTWLVKAANSALMQSHGEDGAGARILKPLTKVQRNLPGIMIADIRYLISVGQSESAFKRVKSLLSTSSQIEQCDVLIDVQIDNLQKLTYLESIQPVHPGPVYCRTMGVLNLNQQLWGNAQGWLEQGWQAGDKPSGVKLAELFEQRGMNDQATKLYRELARGLSPVKQEVNVG